MDTIITLIVIAIMVVSVISQIKAKQKAKPGAKPSNTGGWVAKLNTFIADIQKKIDEQSKESSPGLAEWRQLMDGGNAGISQTDVPDDSLGDLVFEEDDVPVLPEKKPPVRPVRAQAKPSDKKPVIPDAPQRPALRARKTTLSTMAGNRADLRRAVIWSEILGPPVALKDQPGNRR